MKKILVVDDELSILTLLKFNLEKEGYTVDTAEDGKIAFEMAINGGYDFLVLDVMLPSMNGMEITRKLRREKIDVPILILTAKDDQVEKIIGLEIGADDYLTKPFSPREVIARMKAIFRREEITKAQLHTPEQMNDQELEVHQPLLQAGEIIVDPNNFSVNVRGKKVDVTPKEFELLSYFMKRLGRIIPREVLLDRMWSFDFDGTTRIVDVHVSHLREKIELDPKNPKYLVTVRGFGYRFQQPEEK
ncbi:two-component system, OmpR family, alkaline phosphatase synthesis response regulator PhoP [Pilibacter termitis]|uniref:Two-component system, OmpR family, alkaline phosphatase synthesis response regulator PhoP n=1 Tax=Pilibacter termitis TaxID=263852 RepID=A0A1T4M8A2_9ENTE|nr:response regulator transcription factor [Pilibacter termitis]SJZ63125.1 two-component system, OmpR family, alkaline phosphatase synthesis response regulator PhoP [Pilibacter termitis]